MSAPGVMQHFSLQMGLRLVTVAALAASLAWALLKPALPTTALVLAAVLIAVLMSLWKVIQRTNGELARLISALQHGDLAQSFAPSVSGAGYAELASTMEELLDHLREKSQRGQATQQQWQNLVEQVPTPLLTLDDNDQTVALLNHAARHLFDRVHGQRLVDFSVYGPGVVAGLASSAPSFVLDLCPVDDAVQRLRGTQSTVRLLGRDLRLLALVPVQQDIDQSELRLATDLVRVLTHEVMNSLTPVLSLAASASAAAAELPAGEQALRVQTALGAVARRSEGLLQFVRSYKQLAQAPVVRPGRIVAAEWVQDLSLLFEADWPASQMLLSVRVEPPDLIVHADHGLLEQAVLNLLRNAAQACAGFAQQAQVALAFSHAHGGRTLIEVHDNGPGIPPDLREEVFLPFFTTKPDGSGIGLALVRQIALAHGGGIRITESEMGGACLRLVL